MYSFVLCELKDGILIPLHSVIDRIPCHNVTHWRFRDIQVSNGNPFGMPLTEFEEKSRSIPDGLTVTNQEFTDFFNSDIQVIDGLIYGLVGIDAKAPLFCLDCFDTSQWEIITEDKKVSSELLRHGWSPQGI